MEGDRLIDLLGWDLLLRMRNSLFELWPIARDA